MQNKLGMALEDIRMYNNLTKKNLLHLISQSIPEINTVRKINAIESSASTFPEIEHIIQWYADFFNWQQNELLDLYHNDIFENKKWENLKRRLHKPEQTMEVAACYGCVHWGDRDCLCHYMLDTSRPRGVKKEQCYQKENTPYQFGDRQEYLKSLSATKHLDVPLVSECLERDFFEDLDHYQSCKEVNSFLKKHCA